MSEIGEKPKNVVEISSVTPSPRSIESIRDRKTGIWTKMIEVLEAIEGRFHASQENVAGGAGAMFPNKNNQNPPSQETPPPPPIPFRDKSA